MITEQQQEQAALFALSLLNAEEQQAFAAEIRASMELRDFLKNLQRTVDALALSVPAVTPPPGLKDKVLERISAPRTATRIDTHPPRPQLPPGLRFVAGDEASGWKQLPVPGASIKLLAFEPGRGYAVLLGKLEPGVRYPAHVNAGPEDFYILSGDLHVSGRRLGPGDFHHAEAGSTHEENYSIEGCTLLAVLTTDDPLVAFAMA
jgi:anti-sigma factor ChrR (cupin superfamily)